jgi:hypothetical protein
LYAQRRCQERVRAEALEHGGVAAPPR